VTAAGRFMPSPLRLHMRCRAVRVTHTRLGTKRMMAARTPVTDRSTKIQPSMKTAASAVAYGSCETTKHARSVQHQGKHRVNPSCW